MAPKMAVILPKMGMHYQHIIDILGREPYTPLREGPGKACAWIEQQYMDRKSGKRAVT